MSDDPNNDKKAQQAEMLVSVGDLLHSVRALADRDDTPDVHDYLVVASALKRDVATFRIQINKFTLVDGLLLKNAADGLYTTPTILANTIPDTVQNLLETDRDPQEWLRSAVEKCRDTMIYHIHSVPMNLKGKMNGANTPFSVAMKIQDHVSTAINRVHYFDRYLDNSFLERHLRRLNRSVQVRLVTTKGRVTTAKKSGFGILEVQSLATAAAAQFDDFQLIEVTQHDWHQRNLRLDDTILNFGSGASDAGHKITSITIDDCSSQAHQLLDDTINIGTVRV